MLEKMITQSKSIFLVLVLTISVLTSFSLLSESVTAVSRDSTIVLNSGEDRLNAGVIDPNGEYAYFGTYTTPGIIVKIRLSDFTRVGNLTLNPGENEITSAVIDPGGQFAYFGTSTSPGSKLESYF